MMRYFRCAFMVVVWVLPSCLVAQVDHSKVAEFARRFSKTHDMSLEEITVILNNAKYKESTIAKMERPAEGTMTWEQYRNIFIQPERIAAGVTFWKTHENELNEVSTESGVPVEVILGILGVETYFGQRIGDYRVLDALYTLAFGYPKRSSFFKSELEKFLELAEEENLDIYSIKGSYAGAIGYCQFMPSSYLAYAKSFDGSDNRDLMQPDDAIASAANYLKVHRWRSGEPVVAPAKKLSDAEEMKTGVRPSNSLRYFSEKGYIPSGNISPGMQAALVKLENEADSEYWFGFNNFYVITRYNHSALYAMAVYQLGEEIKKAKVQP